MRPVVIALAFLTALPAAGTTIRSFTVEQMTREAAVVVRGTVGQRQSLWNADRSRIYTDTVVQVTEVLSGSKKLVKSPITIRQIGGRVGDTTLSVPGVAPMTSREDVVLFLRTDGKRYYLVGMAQGKFHVRRDAAGVEVLGRDLGGLHFLKGKRVGHEPPKGAPMTYGQLKTRVTGGR